MLADALESGVNLVAAATAYLSLLYAARPADSNHTFGHEKIEFFASGFEGTLILVAGLGTTGYAITWLVHPHPLDRIGLGTAIAGAAAVINFAVARVLLRIGRLHRSPVVEADGHHLMTDVYTTIGVLAGLAVVALTDIPALDPLIAAAVGLHIALTGFRLIRHSFNGLMDHALPPETQDRLRAAIRAVLPPGADFHALRTREAGQRTFAEFHLLVAGDSTVRDAHALAHRVEAALTDALPGLAVTVHIEPIEERESWETAELSRIGERGEP